MSDSAPCPHCNKVIKDLWDFSWDEEVIYAECPHCEKPIDICRRVDVSYSIDIPRESDD